MTKIFLPARACSQAFLTCIFLVASVITARSQTVSGIVRSTADNQPLAGVTIQVKGSSNSTASDAKGYYALKSISPSDSLLFSFIGFRNVTVAVGGRTEINTSLDVEASSLEEESHLISVSLKHLNGV